MCHFSTTACFWRAHESFLILELIWKKEQFEFENFGVSHLRTIDGKTQQTHQSVPLEQCAHPNRVGSTLRKRANVDVAIIKSQPTAATSTKLVYTQRLDVFEER